MESLLMVKPVVNIIIHSLTLSPLSSNVVANIIPVINVMKKRLITLHKYGPGMNGV